ncbi:amino acid ABC transporter substrate-binding protein [Microvirga sp. 17 mud 1-3]|uniref:amino acid ABC transporter substrate-binding protein n=1 Tax=Microvirga sp. 17 mud 1-3 TaxID=2082949 RepID=UPI000D6ABF09|nr:amino acid ABC transporter substrate-binding protein [Microvirga sp. 17 mud 1-3]AWM85385.1 amino acid ABC transporter substrate-binding protein [Microvirga sp. 17 mud 1-3]
MLKYLRNKWMLAAGCLMAATTVASAESGATQKSIKDRGMLNCGVSSGVQTGMSTLDSDAKWSGFEVDFCRAVAAAVLGDPEKIKFVPLEIKTAFATLQSGGIDLLARTATHTFVRDIELNVEWPGVYLYDSQGFLAKKSLGVKSAKELDGASICVSAGSNYELNLADYFRKNGLKFKPVAANTRDQNEKNLAAGRCDVYANVLSALAGAVSKLGNPDDWVVLPELISMEPIGPVVRKDDSRFRDIVAWTLNGLIAAEELGITRANVDEMKASSTSPEVQRLLGVTGDFGVKLGLDNSWAYNAIKTVGNYGEMFERNLGDKSPIKLDRGLNNLWNNKGLMSSPLIR